MTVSVNRVRTNPCPTCGAPVYESHCRSGMGPAGYCDVVCYAAGNTLTPEALLLWLISALRKHWRRRAVANPLPPGRPLCLPEAVHADLWARYRDGWPQRALAREFGIHRATQHRYFIARGWHVWTRLRLRRKSGRKPTYKTHTWIAAKQLRANGETFRSIAERLGIPLGTAVWLVKYRDVPRGSSNTQHVEFIEVTA